MKRKVLISIISVVLVLGTAFGTFKLSVHYRAENLRNNVFELEKPLSNYPVQIEEPVFAFDINDKEKYVQAVDYVFVAKINKIIGTIYDDIYVYDDGKISSTPFTVYEADVNYVLKGDIRVSDNIRLLKRGGVTSDGKWVSMYAEDSFPKEGNTYLCFAYLGVGKLEGEIYMADPNSNIEIEDFDTDNISDFVMEYKRIIESVN